MLNKSIWLKIILGVVVVLALGIVIGFLASEKSPGSFICPSNQSFLDDFQKKFQEKADDGVLPPMTTGSISSINYLWGKIIKIDSNYLVLRIANRYQGGSFSDYVLNQPSFYEIKVMVNDKTQIIQVLPPKPEEMAAGKTPQEKELILSDLKEGATIDVELSEAVDITKIKEISAVKIRLSLPMPQ